MTPKELSFEMAFYDDSTCVEKKFTSSDLQLLLDRDNIDREKYRKKLAEHLRFNRMRPSGNYKEHIQHNKWLFGMLLKTGVMQFEYNMLRDLPDYY